MPTQGNQHSQYVLTHDLGERIQMLGSAGLQIPPPDHPIIVRAQEQLVDDFVDALPEAEVTAMQMSDLAEEVVGIARARWPDAVIVSAYPEIAPAGSLQLEVSRLYDLRALRLGIGSRPGHPTLFEQARALAPKIGEREVVVVDDGIYSGETADRIINAMKAAHINLGGLVAGFAATRARSALEKIKGIGTEVVLARELTDLVTWHPDHDFFPGVPGYGRVVGFKLDGRDRTNLFPLFTHDHASYAFPYLPQFSDSAQLWTRWTDLPDAAAEAIGTHCMTSTRELFEEIERLSGRSVFLKDLLDAPIRANVPLKVGESDFPSLGQRVLEYLDGLS